MRFDVIYENPPFQDNERRKKTQHKLWTTFTQKSVEEWLNDGGYLCLISPQSWGSPSNKVLELFKKNNVIEIHLDTKKHFPDIGSSFSHYLLKKEKGTSKTKFVSDNSEFYFRLDSSVPYIPNDFCKESIEIHKKVMFSDIQKHKINYDYVTCHNVIRHAYKLNSKKIDKHIDSYFSSYNEGDEKKQETIRKKIEELLEKRKHIDITISEEETEKHKYPVFHTNRKVWYSSIQQDFATKRKVMWSRSGYTKPFYDNGKMGCTDMGYYILVDSEEEGIALAKFLNSELMQYVFKTAKWSGFGNELVFSSIPVVDLPVDFNEDDVYAAFGITEEEKKHIKRKPQKKKTRKSVSETKDSKRVKSLGEVFTPLGLVLEMIDMVPLDVWQNPEKTFIDPACGNGNFLTEILRKRVQSSIEIHQALETLYGVDIMEDNISESKSRLFDLAISFGSDADRTLKIINKNIVVGNSLKTNMREFFS